MTFQSTDFSTGTTIAAFDAVQALQIMDMDTAGLGAEFIPNPDFDLEPSVTGHKVYNFEVEHTHTYIAGGIRVHNTSALTFLSDGEDLVDLLRNDDGSVRLNNDGGVYGYIATVDNGRGRVTVVNDDPNTDGTFTVDKAYEYTNVNGDIGWVQRDNHVLDLDSEGNIQYDSDGNELTRFANVEFLNVRNSSGFILGGEVARSLTPFLANAIAGPNASVFETIAVDSVLDTLLDSAGSFFGASTQSLLQETGTDLDVISMIADQSLIALPGNLAVNTLSSTIGVINQLISAEIFEIIGLDGDSHAEGVFQAVAGAGVDQLVSNGAYEILSTDFFQNAFENILGEGTTSIRTYNQFVYGDPLGPDLIGPPNPNGGLQGNGPFSSPGAFTSLLVTAVINEFLPDLETLEGQIASSVTATLITFLSGWGNFAGPAGALIGFAVGTLFDSLFDKDPQAFTNVGFDAETGRFIITGTFSADGGNTELSNNLAQVYLDAINGFIDLTKAESHNFDELGQYSFGHYEDAIKNAGVQGRTFGEFQDAYLDAYVTDLANAQINDGQRAAVRTIENLDVGQLQEEYRLSLLFNAIEINGVIVDVYDRPLGGDGGTIREAVHATTFREAMEYLAFDGGNHIFRVGDHDTAHIIVTPWSGISIGGPNDQLNIREPRFDHDTANAINLFTQSQTLQELLANSTFTTYEEFLEEFPAFVDTKSDAEIYSLVSARLQIANDYHTYLENTETINAMMAASPDSIFAVGWLATLVKAKEAGLADAYVLEGDAEGVPIDNVFYTADGDDSISGLDGDDLIKTYGGDDTLVGGNGNDTLIGGSGTDRLSGGAGNDHFIFAAGDGHDIITGFIQGEDTIVLRVNDPEIFEFSQTVNSDGNLVVAYTTNREQQILDRVEDGEAVFTTITANDHIILEGFTGTLTTDDYTVIEGAVVYGSADSDTLIGGADSDILLGGAGNDVLTGHAGADRLEGGLGTDRAQYHAATSGVLVDLQTAGANTGEAAGDTFISIENLYGSNHDDNLRGNSGVNVLWGAAGNDWLYGRGGNDDLRGGDGNDVLIGGAGVDRLDGGTGTDRAQYSTAASGVTADLQNASVNTGEATGDTYISIEGLYGSSHDDILYGNTGVNSLWGADGNDVLIGGAGADRLDGGTGTDRAQYHAATSGVLVDLQDVSLNTNEAAGDTFFSIENLYGSNHNDNLRGNSGENTLWGANGNDYLYGRGGNDDLRGGDGVDYLTGGTGADRLDGGTGTDRAQYNGATSGVIADLQYTFNNTGEAAGDTYISIENLYGSNHDDNLRGDSGVNVLWGLAGNDWIYGRDGNDDLRGGDGNDVLVGGTGADVLDGGNGIDRAWYYTASGSITADLQYASNNTGEAAGDTYVSIENIQGSNGYGDVLHGNTGANTLWGMGGDDVLIGRAGADRLDGGSGTDRAQYNGATSGVLVDLQNANLNTGEAAGDTFVSIEDIYGSNHNDNLRGNSGANVLWGVAGNDYLYGRAGNDDLRGGDGNDYLTGDTGADILNGGGGTDRAQYHFATSGVTADLQTASNNTGEAAGDTYISIENLYGSNHNDSLRGNSGNNSIWGINGDDWLYGGNGTDALFGGNGNDVLNGYGAGADVLDGGAGIDRARYYWASGSITADLQASGNNLGEAAGDTYVSIENIEGSNSYGDILLGNAEANSLWGAGGNDVLIGRAGADRLDGGSGTDRAQYLGATSGVLVDLQTASANTGEAAGDTFVSIENLYGSNHNDTLRGNSGNNTLWGANGNDSLHGRNGNDVLYGGAGNDRLYGDSGNDVLYGGDGNDYLRGESGNVAYIGGNGTDTASYYGSTSGVTANLATGTGSGGYAAGDTYSSIENLLGSNIAGDTLIGNTGANRLEGAGGNDVLIGGLGADVLDGGSGTDRAQYHAATSGVRVDLQIASLNTGEALGDTFVSIENLYGSNHNDNLRGNAGVNTLWGASGNDHLYGRAGNDRLYGGAGADEFHFASGYDNDIISDFEDGIDTIELSGLGLTGVGHAVSLGTQTGNHVIFDFGSGDTLTIENATLGQVWNDLEVL